MTDEMRARVLKLYTPPFRFKGGYIWDAKDEMIADAAVDSDIGPRIRGWGRMRYLPDCEALYEATGHLFAEALTKFWLASRAAPPTGEGAT